MALAKELKIKPEPVETTWGKAVAGLQADQFDVMFVLDATPQRALAVDFSTQAMFFYTQAVLVRDGLTAANREALNKPEIRIRTVLGTAPDRDAIGRLPKAQVERFPSADESATAFQAGRVDAISLFHPALVMLRSRVKKGNVVLPQPIRESSSSAGGRGDPDKAWREWLGLAMGYLYTIGETQRIYAEYLKLRGIELYPWTSNGYLRIG